MHDSLKHQIGENGLGFSLLEIIMVLVLGSLCLFAVLPYFNKFLMRQEREATLNSLETVIEYAKNEARYRGKIISICITLDEKNCFSGWGNGFMVFENNELLAHPKPQAILNSFRDIQYGKIQYKSWGNTFDTLHINPDGMTYNNGTFTYCPKNLDAREADGIILNKAIRSYRPIERNILGVLIKREEKMGNEVLKCQ